MREIKKTERAKNVKFVISVLGFIYSFTKLHFAFVVFLFYKVFFIIFYTKLNGVGGACLSSFFLFSFFFFFLFVSYSFCFYLYHLFLICFLDAWLCHTLLF
ncbi:membrane hypothetical protein [Candidatus Magnetomoraceae bacterium gMMP-1]